MTSQYFLAEFIFFLFTFINCLLVGSSRDNARKHKYVFDISFIGFDGCLFSKLMSIPIPIYGVPDFSVCFSHGANTPMNYVYSPPAAPPIVPEWNDNFASRTQTTSNSSSRQQQHRMHNSNRLHLPGGRRKVNRRNGKNSAGDFVNASAAVTQPMVQVPYDYVQLPETAPVYNPLNNPIVQYYGQYYGGSPAAPAYYGMAQQ